MNIKLLITFMIVDTIIINFILLFKSISQIKNTARSRKQSEKKRRKNTCIPATPLYFVSLVLLVIILKQTEL